MKFLLQLLLQSLFFGFGISKGYGGSSRKIMEIPGGGGSNVKPSGTENPVRWGVKLEKNPPWGGGGGMDIFWNHTFGIRQSKIHLTLEMWSLGAFISNSVCPETHP